MSTEKIPGFVKVSLWLLGLFMPVFLALPFFFWGGEDGSISLGELNLQEARLKPVGKLVIASAEEVAAASTSAATTPTVFDPEATYKTTCFACHDTGVAGSPLHGDNAAWQARLDARGGLEGLYESGLAGVPGTSMVSKGGATISDEEFHQMVIYMLDDAGVSY